MPDNLIKRVCRLTALPLTGPTLTNVINELLPDDVAAVTSLGDDVFVLRMRSRQQVEVYNAVNCKLQRQITVHGLGIYTFGLAACAHNKCLYVSDSSWYIHRVKLRFGNAAKKWFVGDHPRGLSVNKAHNVVVTCSIVNKLKEYTTDGSLVREICLQAGATDPWHAVQLSSGDYAVSLYTSQVVVSVVRADGQVRRSYGRSQTSDEGQKKYGARLTVTKSDDILVADQANNRILSVDSSLSSVQELTLPVVGGMQRPRGLCLDESRGRLYVGESVGSCRVLVFDNVKL